MTGERHEMLDSPLALRYGYEVLDHGFTAVPNILLQAYRDLGLDDQEAMFVVHLLTRERDKQDISFRLADLPMTCSAKTRKRCLQSLRDKGLVFTRRIYQSGFPARIRHIELDLTNLLHNLVRWSQRGEQGPQPFVVTLAPEVAQRIASGYYHFVPTTWKTRARELLVTATVPAQSGPVLAPVTAQFDPAHKEDLSGDTGRLFEPPGGPHGGPPTRFHPPPPDSGGRLPEATDPATEPSGRPAVPGSVNAELSHGMLAGRAARELLLAEPLPIRRRRVLEDLRRAKGRPRQVVAILTKNLAEILGLDDGGRVIPERDDYGRVGILVKAYGAEKVWTTACRIAGLDIEGDAIAYLQRCLEDEQMSPEDQLTKPERPRQENRNCRNATCLQGKEDRNTPFSPSSLSDIDMAQTALPTGGKSAQASRCGLSIPVGNDKPGLGHLVHGAGRFRADQPPERSTYLTNLVVDIGRQFGDIEHFRENDAQAHNLWWASGLDEGAFVALVYQARQRALRLAGARNRMAYFFAVLRNLALSDAAAGGRGDERGNP